MNRESMKIRLIDYWRLSMVGLAVRILHPADQKKIFLVALLQIFLGLLDLIGIAAIGILGALAVNGVSSRQPGNRVLEVLELLQLENLTLQSQVAVIGIAAAVFLIGRTLISVYFVRRTLTFLSYRSAAVSSKIISNLLSQPILQIQSRSTQQTLFAVTEGVSALTVGVLSPSIIMVSDIAMLLVIVCGLFVVDPSMALGTCALFGFIGVTLYRLLQVRARFLGEKNSRLVIEGNQKILEVLESYRELMVKNRRNFYARQIGKIRLETAATQAEIFFMPNISKYVIEVSVIFGALVISAVQFLTKDAVNAVSTLSDFLAAGTRIAPAAMRIQQCALQIRGSRGAAEPTFELIKYLEAHSQTQDPEREFEVEHDGFNAEIQLKNVSFTYPNQNQPTIKNVSFACPKGSSVAIVGPSGAGKTTLIDLILGVLPPNNGSIEISEMFPMDCIVKWPGSIAYVPQDILIANGTIRSNVALGYPIEVATDDLVWKALETAKLSEMAEHLDGKLDANVGERGSRLSGGQRQRLGIARALFSNPKLLVLDEATSALDGQTEADIAHAINSLKGKVTILMIAHRLSTVRNADLVLYINNGELIAQGSFDEVRKAVKDFDNQANLMGL
jgi:ABC-type multidrug transport system fused ATPase/permease subunit